MQMSGSYGSGSHLAEEADVGEVAEMLVGVHAVADEVLRGGAEAVPVGLRLLLFGRNVLVDQDAGTAGGGAFRQDLLLNFRERKTGIQDVVDQEDMAVLQAEFQLAAHREFASGFVVEVGPGREGIHPDGHRDLAQQVRGKEDSAVHDDDGSELKSGIGGGNLGGEFGHAFLKGGMVVQGGEGNGHRGGQSPFPAAFLRVPVVE